MKVVWKYGNLQRAGCLFLLLPIVAVAQQASLLQAPEKDPLLKHASVGYCVTDVRNSETVFAFNPSTALVPASTLKIVTTTAALRILGGNFRYETRLCYTGTFNKETGIINGNLIISGSGDPSLGSEYFPGGKMPLSDQWALALKQKGVRGITGAIIADASCFERKIPDNWIWADISNYFGALPCGLSFMDNKFGIYFRSGPAGSTATITSVETNYMTKEFEISSNVLSKGSSDQAYVYGDPFGWKKQISGSIPPNRGSFRIEAALPDPALLCAESLYQSLVKTGIKCQAEVRSEYSAADTSHREVMLRHFSPTLDQLIHHTNLKSDNLYCESFVLTIGNGSHEKGLEKIKSYWQSRGLNISELFMTDGSGLSRANTITTEFQATMLGKIARDSLAYGIISRSMPTAGLAGSMRNIGKGTGAEGNLRAKTGYINRARAYCGYVTGRSGRLYAFSVIVNNYNCTAAEARLILEKFMVSLAGM